jgi:GGDEF domain-containing protein
MSVPASAPAQEAALTFALKAANGESLPSEDLKALGSFCLAQHTELQFRGSSSIDGLTGFYRREETPRLMTTEVLKVTENDSDKPLELNVTILDVDELHNINTIFDHAGGDKVIEKAAVGVHSYIDYVFNMTGVRLQVIRYGGDEFVIFGALDPKLLRGLPKLTDWVNNGLGVFAGSLPNATLAQHAFHARTGPKLSVTSGAAWYTKEILLRDIDLVGQESQDLERQIVQGKIVSDDLINYLEKRGLSLGDIGDKQNAIDISNDLALARGLKRIHDVPDNRLLSAKESRPQSRARMSTRLSS